MLWNSELEAFKKKDEHELTLSWGGKVRYLLASVHVLVIEFFFFFFAAIL